MLDAIRRWLGATRRERELRALADGLQAECDRWMRKIAANAKVHEASLAALRAKLEEVIAERDEARRELDDEREQRYSLSRRLDRLTVTFGEAVSQISGVVDAMRDRRKTTTFRTADLPAEEVEP